jgi:nucleotide-binding universal stress UspA family protein
MYRRILVPIDRSDTSQRGLREAIALAAQNRARLRVLHVVDTLPLYVSYAPAAALEETLGVLRSQGETLVQEGCRLAKAANVDVESALRDVGTSRVADHILADAVDWRADLIVMGTHGRRGFSRFALGSDAEIVARASPVPLLLVRAPGSAEGSEAAA